MRGSQQSALPAIARSRRARGDRHRLTLRDMIRPDTLDAHAIADALHEGAPLLGPDASLAEAARYMLQRGTPRALVVEEAMFLGMVTSADLVRALATGACPASPQRAHRSADSEPGVGHVPSLFFLPWLP